jgi:hypothetical protein
MAMLPVLGKVAGEAGGAVRGAGAAEEAAAGGGLSKIAGSAGPDAGIAVIGKFPRYLELAEELGAKRFNIPPNIASEMSEAQMWAANVKFLDRSIARGDTFILASPTEGLKATSGYAKELDYILSKGYRYSIDGRSLIRP